MSGSFISRGLQDTIRTNGTPAVTRAGKQTTLSSTMTSGRVRSMISSKLRLAVLCAADELLPDRPHPRVQLLDRRLAELGRGVADEILPELPGTLGSRSTGTRRRQVNKVFLKAKRLQPPLPGRLGREHDPVAAAAQNIADPDAVVGRPVRALGQEEDRQRPLAHNWLPTLRPDQIPDPTGSPIPEADRHNRPAGMSTLARQRQPRRPHRRPARAADSRSASPGQHAHGGRSTGLRVQSWACAYWRHACPPSSHRH